MPLITISDLSMRFRGPSLFDGVNCTIEAGERIGLLGRNGTGKTTLMRIIAGLVEPDHGQISLNAGVSVALLPQGVPQDILGTVQAFVRQGVRYQLESGSFEAADSAELNWQADHKVEKILSRMGLDPFAIVASMSSGMKRRVLLAQSLVDQPDLLLLDEPTNHLDIEAITWLEDFLLRWPATLMFVTHDRQFLKRLANRIWEIDAGQLFDWSCDYSTFLKRKEEALAAQEKQDALFSKRLAEEEVWIRQGIKARRTRNEGRVRRLEEMRRLYRDRRTKVGVSSLKIQTGERSGNLVTQVEGVSFSHSEHEDDSKILNDFSITLMRGDAVGIIGPNGSGKTTLLKILLGELKPQSGTVRLGTNLKVAYFDQLREQLNEEQTIEQNVADGYQSIQIDGKPRHVLSYLQDFLFTAERARTAIKFLSGGERSRVLLAKLFAKPANVIVLDEPTNDLDAETLEMLEERLTDFSGTLLVVSHDREFLNNVVTSTIVIEVAEDGTRNVQEFVGGYDDWQRQISNKSSRVSNLKSTSGRNLASPATSAKPVVTVAAASNKLTFKEQRELESLPLQITHAENSIESIHREMADPEFYKQSRDLIAAKQNDLQSLEDELSASYRRWEELDSRSS